MESDRASLLHCVWGTYGTNTIWASSRENLFEDRETGLSPPVKYFH